MKLIIQIPAFNEEGTIAQAGMALEREFNVTGERPPGF